MTGVASRSVAEAVDVAVAGLDVERIHQEYWDQDEFVFLKHFLPPDLVTAVLATHAERLKSRLNRNYIPGHKKGGSVSYYTLREEASDFIDLYRSPAFLEFLNSLVHARLMLCPDNDPHACALYYYTKAGDHIGFHYDTSHYKGARYTILMGVVDRSPQCQLVCQLHKDNPNKETRELRLATEPGDLIVFNGDKLWHAVTPLGEGEERIALTMEYVTNQEMGPFKRIYSNLKDAFAYFGIRTLFKGKA